MSQMEREARQQAEEEEKCHMSEVVLFTIGYLAPYAEEILQQLKAQGSLIADIRSNPTSRLPQWRQGALRKRFGERYLHIPTLGNVTYRTKGLITLAQPEEGIAQVVDWLRGGQSVTLLCACRSHEHCHRTQVAKLVKERLPELRLLHLPVPPKNIVWTQTQARWEIGHGTNHD